MASASIDQVDNQISIEKGVNNDLPKADECLVETNGDKHECLENGKAVSPKKGIREKIEKAAGDANHATATVENSEEPTPTTPAEECEQKNGHTTKETTENVHRSPTKSHNKQPLSQSETETEEPSPKKARKSLEEKPEAEADIVVNTGENVEDAKNGEIVASTD